MKMTVADVSKVLASVARICECNNRVVFDEDGVDVMVHKRNGVYVMDVWTPSTKSGFGGAGPVSDMELPVSPHISSNIGNNIVSMNNIAGIDEDDEWIKAAKNAKVPTGEVSIEPATSDPYGGGASVARDEQDQHGNEEEEEEMDGGTKLKVM